MLTRILHNSPNLGTFFEQLSLDLSKPQRQHILNMADALLVCEDQKSLAALQRQFVQAPDASNMADFLRISPWQANDVRHALRMKQVTWALKEAEATDAPKVIYLNLDDSLGEKDKATRHLEPVDWFHDHHNSPQTNRETSAVQKRLLLCGLYVARWPDCGHSRLTLVCASQNRAPPQSPAPERRTPKVSK